MVSKVIDTKIVLEELEKIMDPEIPVMSLVEMKIIRDIRVDDTRVSITLSPTFVACPALEQMKQEIRTRLFNIGCSHVNIAITFSPPWSTDMLEEATLDKLRVFGISPPPPAGKDPIAAMGKPVRCPQCGSEQTRMQSPFGSTLCKQLFVCGSCQQPFERFKPV